MRPVRRWVLVRVSAQVAVPMLRPAIFALVIVGLCSGSLAAQKSAGPPCRHARRRWRRCNPCNCPALRRNRRRASGADRRVRDGPFIDSLRGPEHHSEPKLAA